MIGAVAPVDVRAGIARKGGPMAAARGPSRIVAGAVAREAPAVSAVVVIVVVARAGISARAVADVPSRIGRLPSHCPKWMCRFARMKLVSILWHARSR